MPRKLRGIHPYIVIYLDFPKRTDTVDMDTASEEIERVLRERFGFRKLTVEVHY